MLALQDFKDQSEEYIKEHLARNYSGKDTWYEPDNEIYTADEIRDILEEYDILIAYESEGICGCDSTSWFLLQKNVDSDKKFFLIIGDHDSIAGFEQQFQLEATCREYLIDPRLYIEPGLYDRTPVKNVAKIRQYLQEMFVENDSEPLF